MKNLITVLFFPFLVTAMDTDSTGSSPDSCFGSPLSSPRPYNSPKRSVSHNAIRRVRRDEEVDSPPRCSPRGRHSIDVRNAQLADLKEEEKQLTDQDDIKVVKREIKKLETEVMTLELAGQKIQKIIKAQASEISEKKAIPRKPSRRKSVIDLFKADAPQAGKDS